MSIETRGQWLKLGDGWIDAAAVVCVERHDEAGRTLVGLSSGACADCAIDADEVIEAVHVARRFADVDLSVLPNTTTRTSAAKAWRARSRADRSVVAATIAAGADRAEQDGFGETAVLLRAAAAALEEVGGTA